MTVDQLIHEIEETTAKLRGRIKETDESASTVGYFSRKLEKLRAISWLRPVVTGIVIVGFFAVIAYFVVGLLPRNYSLTVSGGDILSNRHQLAMAMRDEGTKTGLFLDVRPMSGTFAILDAVDNRTVDAAFIQGGLDSPRENIRHVARILPETLHLLVREDVQTLADLKGRTINMGSAQGGTRIVGEQVLLFSGLRAGVDYVPSAYSSEELLALPARKMPDAIVTIATVPSFLAEEIIRKKGFGLLEIPFPKALALRHGWVADSRILPYTYKTTPPLPDKELQSIGVDLFLVAHKDVPDLAVLKLLDVLYSPGVRNSLRLDLDPATVGLPSGYELSDGTDRYMRRNDPLLSQEDFDRLTAVSGLLLSGLTFIFMGVRYLRSRSRDQVLVDTEYRAYLDLAKRLNGVLAGCDEAESEKQRRLGRLVFGFRALLLERTLQFSTVDAGVSDALDRSLEMSERILRKYSGIAK